ncbi:NAD(P)-dependent dehydrogenase, short-chain alcohol dehydrogenase family [Klenkia soli]|uniref:NAD(P)-dependent dehydrogenase, short-chain alcohol dehydrogenase family n=1 Tax=Klenkia soli TaxID=1052260 RepID=A0A1H0SK65_9ACTN|nr:SDR family NAD(P)-dependent oxidoreductase [Klenkia soli]SDP42134.1 NAD(P)-dependent dehydrogenase, short-chain alcohol dehydrogenase family [Klenkia soli]
MSTDLAGLPVVVTGSTRGLGRAFAQGLAAAGARVVVNGTDADRTAAVVEEIAAGGGSAVGCAGSVAEPGTGDRLVDTCVQAFGSVGMVVTNAGVTRDRSLARMSDAEFDEVLAVNLRGTWDCSRAAVRAMRGTGGAVLHVTSGSGLFGTAGQTNYAAAKAGVVGLTRAMDLELHRRGIRVNALAPVARTDMTAVFEAGDVGHALVFPPPETVAPVVVFLASARAAHLHGQVLSFDGSQLSVWTHPAPAATWEQPDWTDDAFAAALTADVQQPRHPDRWGAGIGPS